MKKLTMIGTMGLMVSMAMGCQAQQDVKPTNGSSLGVSTKPTQVVNISWEEFESLRSQNPQMRLVDVRTEGEVSGGFVGGTTDFVVFDDEFTEKAVKNLPKGSPVALYCKAGGRSSKASNILTQQGFGKVYNITGGIDAWISKGKPLVNKD